MSNEQLKFWITCPDCRKPFGVEPRSILQYLNRVMDAKAGGASRENESENGGEAASKQTGERADSSASKAMPTGRQAPYKPPYRNYRKGSYGKREWTR